MTQAEQKSSLKSAIQKHKEFLFPAVATYYQEPLALVKGEGEHTNWRHKNTGLGAREQGST